MAVERDEIPGFEDFYKPLTSREQTLPKLQALRARPMTDVGNGDLFEALADTFATHAREDFQAGKSETSADGTEYPYGDWDEMDEVKFQIDVDGDWLIIGEWRDSSPRVERFFIHGITQGGDFDFDRDWDGSVSAGFYRENSEDESLEPHEVTDAEKKAILDTCIAAFSS